jgi:hypothetical protein
MFQKQGKQEEPSNTVRRIKELKYCRKTYFRLPLLCALLVGEGQGWTQLSKTTFLNKKKHDNLIIFYPRVKTTIKCQLAGDGVLDISS